MIREPKKQNVRPQSEHSSRGAPPRRRGLHPALALFCALTALSAVRCDRPVEPAGGPPAPEAAPVALAISPSNPQLAQGTAQPFSVRGLFADGQSQELTPKVRWTVRDAGGRVVPMPPVDKDGIVPFSQPGRYFVTAEYAGRSLETPVTVSAATISSISVSPSTPRVPKGLTKAFTATAKFSDGTTQDVTKMAAWSVKDVTGVGVATIDSTGLATATAVGKTKVAARYLTRTSSTTLEVTPAALVTLAVSPSSPTIAKGTSQVFTAQGVFSDGTLSDLTALATWSVADLTGTGVAAIDGTGKAFGKSPGVAAVSAEYLGTVTETRLTVTAAAVVTLSVSPTTASIPKGTTQRFTATASLTDGTTQDVTTLAGWSAADLDGTSVASVDSSGVAKGNGVGKARITATYGGRTIDAQLQVTPAVLTALSVEPSSLAVPLGIYKKLRAFGTFSDGTTQDLSTAATWTATDVTGSGVASVDATGLVQGKARGTARIDANYGVRTASATVDVTAAVITGLVVAPATATIARGATQQYTATASFSDGSKVDVSAAVTWTARDLTGTGAASIDATGLASGKSEGSVEISATYLGSAATAQLVVSAITLLPTPTVENLWGIWGPAENDIWTAGNGGVVLHWNGTAWTRVPTGYTGSISSVWGSSASDVWFGTDSGNVLHWDGTGLTSVTTSLGTWALGLWGSSATDVWASGAGHVAHWNGTAWTVTTLPNSAGNAVWGSGPSDVWAVGSLGSVSHFDGTKWSAQTTPVPDALWGISGSGARDVWAVGTNGAILHFGGTSWTRTTSPSISWLVSVASRGPGEAYIAGWDATVLRWDGSSWTPLAIPTTKKLLGTFVGPTSVWFTGYDGITLRK